jgi:hypothetical protein
VRQVFDEQHGRLRRDRQAMDILGRSNLSVIGRHCTRKVRLKTMLFHEFLLSNGVVRKFTPA